jgi:hypothetical protein
MSKLSITLTALVLFATADTCHAKGHLWAGAGQPLDIVNDIGRWKAPNGAASIYSDDAGVILKLGRNTRDISGIFASPWLAEAVWSEEAKGVFVNASDGGGVGTWRSRAFVDSGAGMREIPIRKAVTSTHALTSTCKYLNIVSVGWIEAGKALLVMEQVPASSACSNMDVGILFVIDVTTGKVRETLSSADAVKRYSDVFGERVDDVFDLPIGN